MKNKTIHMQVTLRNGQLVGFFDGEYVTSNAGLPLYRIDSDEIYTCGVNAQLIGHLSENTAKSISGDLLFTLS